MHSGLDIALHSAKIIKPLQLVKKSWKQTNIFKLSTLKIFVQVYKLTRVICRKNIYTSLFSKANQKLNNIFS